jgi:hypothetical protein
MHKLAEEEEGEEEETSPTRIMETTQQDQLLNKDKNSQMSLLR